MLAELCRVLTDLGRADQQLERTAEPPAAPGNDQIVDAALGRRHFRWRDVAIPGHFFSYSLERLPPAVREARQHSRSGQIRKRREPSAREIRHFPIPAAASLRRARPTPIRELRSATPGCGGQCSSGYGGQCASL